MVWMLSTLLMCGCLGLKSETKEAQSALHRIQEKSVAFTNGMIVLKGTLMEPEPPTQFPTVVMVHGSGPADRKGFLFAPELVRAGIPVLVYDKRGVGESGGNWEVSSIHELATDVLAAVDSLKEGNGTRRIGLWGGSQGGWIVPLAATLCSNVSFIISVSGAGVSPAEQMLYYQENNWRESKLSQDEIEQLRKGWKLFYNYCSSGNGKEALDDFVKEMPKRGLRDDRWPPSSSEIADKPFFFNFGYGFNPMPHWQKVKCPVLAIWGERDQIVPAETSSKMIEKALKSSGNTNYTIKIFRDADHGISVPGKQRLPEGWVDWRFAPEYVETMIDWIKKQ